jgi:hypothetical protein
MGACASRPPKPSITDQWGVLAQVKATADPYERGLLVIHLQQLAHEVCDESIFLAACEAHRKMMLRARARLLARGNKE